MKRKLSLLIFIILTLIICVSCNSCVSSSGQTFEITSVEDTAAENNQDTLVLYLVSEEESRDFSLELSPMDQDTTKKSDRTRFRKDIKQMEIDKTWKLNADSTYNRLEKAEEISLKQKKLIDSLIIIKK